MISIQASTINIRGWPKTIINGARNLRIKIKTLLC